MTYLSEQRVKTVEEAAILADEYILSHKVIFDYVLLDFLASQNCLMTIFLPLRQMAKLAVLVMKTWKEVVSIIRSLVIL